MTVTRKFVDENDGTSLCFMVRIMGDIFQSVISLSFMPSFDFRRLPMGLFMMREKYSDLYEALRVRDDECMK